MCEVYDQQNRVRGLAVYGVKRRGAHYYVLAAVKQDAKEELYEDYDISASYYEIAIDDDVMAQARTIAGCALYDAKSW